MNWYLDVLRKYATFSGRARRKEYWMFILFNIIITLLLAFVFGLLGDPGFVMGLYSLAVFIPSLAVTIRRLHDTNKTGWWILVSFIPLIGTIIMLIFMLIGGTEGDNEFGPDPKAI